MMGQKLMILRQFGDSDIYDVYFDFRKIWENIDDWLARPLLVAEHSREFLTR